MGDRRWRFVHVGDGDGDILNIGEITAGTGVGRRGLHVVDVVVAVIGRGLEVRGVLRSGVSRLCLVQIV